MTSFDLKSVELFASLPVEDLARLGSRLEMRELAEGETLFREGEPGDNAYIVAEGELEIIKEDDGRETRIALSGEGALVGEMALLTDSVRNATARAKEATTLVVIPRTVFEEIINSSGAAMRAVFDVFIKRSHELEARVRQAERMAQLGTLTAGLAHEMNNPSAAVLRGSEHLRGIIDDLQRTAASVTPGAIDQLADTGSEAPLSALERADREEALEAILEARGVDNPWDVAPALVKAGIGADEVAQLGEQVDFAAVARALAVRADAEDLLAEIQEGAKRLAELVGALKSYSFLDRAPVQETDVVKGIEDTLLILRSKTKDIEIVRDFADDLPRITAHGSLLNQVWTNLIDNAADAVRGQHDARIEIAAVAEDGHIVVTVTDNGPGIPTDVVDHIFEAFYTTKPPGAGTGIGLNTVYGIVVNDHRGSIDVDSAPGRTVFTVKVPINS